MPTYDYMCHLCLCVEEVIHKITETPLVLCPKCTNTHMQKKPGIGCGVHFTGTGFYETDYKGKK